MKYALVLIFALDTARGVSLHSQDAGLYDSEDKAIEAGKKAERNASNSKAMNRTVEVYYTVLPAPAYTEISAIHNYN